MSRKPDSVCLHSYQFEVTIDRVMIQIKFPCSIGASLKLGKQQSTSKQVKLSNGVAEINQKLQLKTTLLYDNATRQYTQKKVNRRNPQSAIYIHVISQTGRNTAGICQLNLVDLVTHTPYDMVRRPLERCPDHDAQVSFRVRCKFEEELPYQQDGESFSCENGRQSSEGKGSKTELSLVHQSAEFSMMDTNSKPRLEPAFTSPTREFKETLPKEPVSAQPVRLLEEVESDLGWRPKPRSNAIPQRNFVERHSSTEGEGPSLLASMNLSSNSRIMKTVGNTETMLDVERRAARLQAQRDNQIKQITSLNSQVEVLRGQLYTKSSKEVELSAELDKLKRKVESQQLQIDTMKKSQEKAGKLSQKVSEEFQQKLAKMSDLEQQVRILKTHKEVAEKASKEKARQAQELAERLEDINSSQATLQKRLDMKDTFYKEQMKKYSEKLVQCELQKQKMMSQLQALRGVSEDKERRIQSLLKDRDKLLTQQKNKLTKKYDQLRQEYEKLSSEKLTERQQLLNINGTLQKLKAENAELNLQKIRLQQQIERLKTKLVSESIQKNKIEEQLKAHTNASKNVLLKQTEVEKKDKNDLLETVQKQLDEKIELNRQLTDKASDLQKRLKEKEMKMTDQEFQIDSLKKKFEVAKKSLDKKTEDLAQQQEEFSDQVSMAQQEKTELQAQIRKLQRDLSELNGKNNRLVAELAQKTQLLTQLQDSKLRASTNSLRLEDRIKRLTEETKTLLAEVESLKAKQFQFSQEITKISQQRDTFKLDLDLTEKIVKEKEAANDCLTHQVQDLKHRLEKAEYLLNAERESAAKISSDFERLLGQKEELSNKNGELITKISNSQIQIEALTKKLESYVEQIQQFQNEKEQANSLFLERNSQLEGKQSEIERLLAQIEQSKNIIQKIEEDKKNSNDQSKNIHQQLKVKQDELAQVLKKQQQLANEKEYLLNSLTVSQEQMKMYQQKVIQNVRTFYQIFLKNDASAAQEINNLEEKCDNQVSCILGEVLHIYKQSKSMQLEKDKQMESQIKLLKQQQVNDQAQISHMKQHITNLSIDVDVKQQERYALESRLSQRQLQLQIEITNLRQQQSSLEFNIQDLNGRLNSVLQSYDKLQEQNDELQSTLAKSLAEAQQLRVNLQHSSKQLQYKQAEIDSMNSQLTTQNKTLIELRDRTFAQQSDLQKQLSLVKAQLNEKCLRIEELQANLQVGSELKTQIQTLKAALIEAEEKIFSASVEVEDLSEKLKVSSRREKEFAEKVSSTEQMMFLQETSMSQLEVSQMGWESRLRDTEQLLKKSEKERESLARRLAHSESQYQNTQFVVNSMRNDMQAAQQQLDQALNNLRNKQAYLNMIQGQLNTKSKHLSEQTQQLSKLKDTNSRVLNELKLKKCQLEQLEQVTSCERNSLLAELEAVNNDYNTLRAQLEEEEKTNQGLKKAYDKDREEWQYREGKLEAEIVELNEQMYSISSDVNTMRLREEEDQETMDKLQQENATLINLYLTEKKKNSILSESSPKNDSEDMTEQGKVQDLQKEIQELKDDIAKKNEQIQRFTAENEYLQRQVLDNPMVKELEEKADQIARAYEEELIVLQQILNRERKDFQLLRREYHQKCIVYQQKIRALEIQFRSAKEEQQRLETIQEEKSSNLSEIGRCPSQTVGYVQQEDQVKRLSRELQHKNSDILIYEQQIRQMEETITKLQTSASVRDVQALQKQIKRLILQKTKLVGVVEQLTGTIGKLKAKALGYCRLPAENRDITSQFKLVQAKISQLLECTKDSTEETFWQKGPSPTQSTDIIQSSSMKDIRNAEEIVQETVVLSPKGQSRKMHKSRNN